jgi:hypothetical protein
VGARPARQQRCVRGSCRGACFGNYTTEMGCRLCGEEHRKSLWLALYVARVCPAARDAWAALSSICEDHSNQLCEALRLILEPTLASRLEGDFKTGKRINIRKVRAEPCGSLE